MIKIFEVEDSVLIKNKKFALNLNIYRNAHYQVLNAAKVNFKANLYAAYPELFHIRAASVVVSYEIRPRSKKVFDTMNIISIVDKFFLDAIVEAGVIPDDCSDYVTYGTIKTAPPDLSFKTDKNKKIVISCCFLP